jgi:hypothetical protein
MSFLFLAFMVLCFTGELEKDIDRLGHWFEPEDREEEE